MKTTLVLSLLAAVAGIPALAQDLDGDAPLSDAAPADDAAAAPADAAPAALPAEKAPVEEARTPAARKAPVVSATTPAPSTSVAERGGMLGLGLVVAPKVGGGLGSVFLAGAGGTFAGELELGYSLPLELPRGRDLQLFTSVGYAAPSSTATVDANDPRLPNGGDFTYRLVLQSLVANWGLLYRLPVLVDGLEWMRPYVALGARTIWSWTVMDADAGGEAFGSYTESAFELGGYGALGSDFYVGPGAILVELQTAASGADRFILRETSNLSVQLAVGYRLFL